MMKIRSPVLIKLKVFSDYNVYSKYYVLVNYRPNTTDSFLKVKAEKYIVSN